MAQGRFRRLQRRGLTPSKAFFVYGLAFLMVAWHQAGPLAEWFESQALNREGFAAEAALTAAEFFKKKIAPHGPAQLNRVEDGLIGRLTAALERGPAEPRKPAAVSPAAPPPPAPPSDPSSPERALAPPVWPPPETAGQAAPSPEESGKSLSGPSSPGPPPEPPAPEPAPPEPPAPEPEKFKPATVLLLGDSMMLEGLGPQLQKELRRYSEYLNVVRDGRYGTGLTRLDYFDWLGYFEGMLEKRRPDLVILTIGANDPQDILNPPEDPAGRRRVILGSEDWNALYAARARRLLEMAAARDARVFWIGLPIMGLQPYGRRVAAVNAVAAAACEAAPNCRFWDSWSSVADGEGRFSYFATDENGRRQRIRAKDSIHLTEDGGRIMAKKFLAETEGWADYRAEKPAMPEPAMPEPAAPPEPREKTAPAPPESQGRPALRPLGAPPLPPSPEPAMPEPAMREPAMPEPAMPEPPSPEPAGTTELEGPEAAPEVAPPEAEEPGMPAPAAAPAVMDEEWEFVEPDELSNYPSGSEPAPSAGDGGEEEAGVRQAGAQWVEFAFPAPALGRASLVRLALPRPGPARPGPFPVVFLLHGAWDGPESWERELGRPALLELADRLGLILALPEGGPFGWYLDGRETAMETFILADFLPEVLKNPLADGRRLGVAGLSMGGHGALTLAFKRPDLFKAAAALSAVADLSAHAGGHPVDSELKIERVLGPAGPAGLNWRPFGAAGLWESAPAAWGGRPLFLGVGLSDALTLTENRAFHRQLESLGVKHVYEEKPGGHDWAYWRGELPPLVAFLARVLSAPLRDDFQGGGARP